MLTVDKMPLLWDLFTHLLDVNSVEPNGNGATHTADPLADTVLICMNSNSNSNDSAEEQLEYWTVSWDALQVDLVRSDDCYCPPIPPLFQSDLVCLLNGYSFFLFL